MSKSSPIREGYRTLYEYLKSEKVSGRLDRTPLTDSERKTVHSFIERLPHPSVASAWDVYDVSKVCLEGSIPGLGGEAVRHARELMSTAKKLAPQPGEESSIPAPPHVPERPSTADVAKAVDWGNRLLARLAAVALSTNEKSLEALKTRCPFCLEEMVLTISKDEAVLRCVRGTTPRCRKTVWRLFPVSASEE